MTLIDRGQAALNARMKAAAGRTVTYTRGVSSASVTAWVGRTDQPAAQDQYGARQEWADRDYLLAVADLTAAGFGSPQAGDRITETIAGTAVTFELVVPAGANDQAWRYSDQTRTVYRLHTKQV